MKKTLIMMVLAMVLGALPAHAVLKERNMEQAMSVLRTELTMMHKEQQQRVARFNEMSKRFDKMMVQVMDRCQQIELMLYSQRTGYIFDLAYACSEATSLHNQMASSMLPFETFANHYNDQVMQYVRLVKSLEDIPDFILTTEQLRNDRDSCMVLAKAIATDMAVQRIQLDRTRERAQMVLNKSKLINDFALKIYDDIRQSIFVNGDQSYFSTMGGINRYWRQGVMDLSEKYRPAGKTHSEWRGNLIFFLFMFILSYILISTVVSWLAIRYLLPRRWMSDEFNRKRGSIIVAVSALLFAVVTFVISNTLTDHNFMIMAAGLLSEYAWLLAAIMFSIIIRLKSSKVMSGIRLYIPILVVGFIVFVYRITFMPNTIVNLTFPPILLAATIWQADVIRRHGRKVPRTDKIYTWASLLVMVTSLVMAWVGYTLMSVQVLIWWIMQLTVIQGITVIYYWLHKYQAAHIKNNDDITQTWLFDAVYKMIIPIAATFSVAGTIYWAAKVFDLTDWCIHFFKHKIVDIPDVIVISLERILFLVALAFVFNFIIYLLIKLYIFWKEYKTKSKNQVVALSKNIMKYVGWIIYAYIAMVVLNVNRAGITLILTGLSTGIGFAMKDTLENLFYGLSLMSGRVKLGDVIECDGIRGKVTNINYQSTLVETIDGSVIAFLNSQLFNKNFKNMTRNHGYEMVKVPVGVAYGSHVDRVRELIIERLSTLNIYDKKKGIQVLFNNFGDSSVDLIVVLWVKVMTCVADIATVKEHIYQVLGENGVEIPFPQTDIHIKTEAPSA
ncbi:MAG: mechanosensitive ion channel family protein [Muribaculaceae bacterium]|nr:mechanosensitive ion channel family protein [Muribaculaceae bacterium]